MLKDSGGGGAAGDGGEGDGGGGHDGKGGSGAGADATDGEQRGGTKKGKSGKAREIRRNRTRRLSASKLQEAVFSAETALFGGEVMLNSLDEEDLQTFQHITNDADLSDPTNVALSLFSDNAGDDVDDQGRKLKRLACVEQMIDPEVLDWVEGKQNHPWYQVLMLVLVMLSLFARDLVWALLPASADGGLYTVSAHVHSAVQVIPCYRDTMSLSSL